METREIDTDVLIVGGGTAGCWAALTLAGEVGENREERMAAAKAAGRRTPRVLIVEKAAIERSGCLAAGVNALNAYITPGHTPQDYVEYARKDAEGIIRDDLALSACERLNEVTRELDRLGLVILRGPDGEYAARGWRNIKINGENIKPLLARAVREAPGVEVLEHVNVTDLLTEPVGADADARAIAGAVGFSVREPVAYTIRARAVLVATGGAAGIYKPNNPGFSRHKMWYPPFNTGAGYAMGLRAGAEMTTLEMRFVALRCKDTIAPTGTIAQGVGAKQVNARGEVYETKYGLTTSERVYGTVHENLLGHGPCYLRTSGIDETAADSLLKAYLNMAPSQTLKWIESGKSPAEQDVEIDGTEPYVVGGHTASGYWVDTERRATLPGLYAAGDVAGGFPQKYVTGALAEGAIAAETIATDLAGTEDRDAPTSASAKAVVAGYERHLAAAGAAREAAAETAREAPTKPAPFSAEELEEAMQKTMDAYAGGISAGYGFNDATLAIARDRIGQLEELAAELPAATPRDLLEIYELTDRLTVARALIAHLGARHETRWHVFDENLQHPERDDEHFGRVYIESVMDAHGGVRTFERPLVKEARYEHSH